jgi:predicted ribosomally synthesized peptide with SipW-like signal peptide
MSAKVTSSTARKVVGSLGVIGAAAAVAGMGTFGSFTDSSTPVSTTIQAGTLNIDVTTAGAAVPVSTPNFVPGDSMTRAINLKNSGDALGSISFTSAATVGGILTDGTANGLQLAVKSCSVPWTQGGTAQAPTYTCAGTTTDVVPAGPVLRSNVALTNPKSLASNGTDYLTFTISLPAAAGNAFQGQSAALSLGFVGTQATAGNR